MFCPVQSASYNVIVRTWAGIKIMSSVEGKFDGQTANCATQCSASVLANISSQHRS
jgi:hypothetical protein